MLGLLVPGVSMGGGEASGEGTPSPTLPTLGAGP